MPNPAKTVILRTRVDQSLLDALTCSARAAGTTVADLVRDTLRAAHDRRARVCASLGLARGATDAQVWGELACALASLTPVEEAEASRSISDVGHALSFVAARASTKRRQRSSATAQSAGKPAAHTRSSAPVAPVAPAAPARKVLISADEYDRLLALRAKRCGATPPPRGASGGTDVWIRSDDPDLRVLRGSK